MTTNEGRTKIPPAAGGEAPGWEAEEGPGGRAEEVPDAEADEDPDDGPPYEVPLNWDYGAHAAPGEASRLRTFFSRRDELDVIVKMLVRHHGFEPGRARAVVWGQPGLLPRLLSQKGRPPKPHLVQDADIADEILSSGKEVRWDVVHSSVVALNYPQESRTFEYDGERSTEPRNSEDWQRAVRRIRNRLRAVAASLAARNALTS